MTGWLSTPVPRGEVVPREPLRQTIDVQGVVAAV
jgi:hypothetical protein